MKDRGVKDTDRLLSDLEQELVQLYNLSDDPEELQQLLEQIFLNEENVTQKKRLDHAKENGLDELIELYTTYIISLNEQAASRITAGMEAVNQVNRSYMRQYFKQAAGEDIGYTDIQSLYERYGSRSYSKFTQPQYVSNRILKEINKGIRKGEGIPKLANRIKSVSRRSRNNARLVARTETTRIQNLSRIESLYDARDLYGLPVKKQWISTDDDRTRDSHVVIDGDIAELEELFSNGLLFPGDPNDDAEEVCNCRCTLTVYLDYDQNSDIIRSGYRGALDPFSDRAEAHAKRYYDSVRRMRTDVRKIADNTGMDMEKVAEIKEHIFMKEHDLGDLGVKRFDSDYDMAVSWQRLIKGRDIQPHDYILLNHEYMELTLMKQGYTQQQAHNITNKTYNYSQALKERRTK